MIKNKFIEKINKHKEKYIDSVYSGSAIVKDGEEVFTTRIYNEKIDFNLKIKSNRKVDINKWSI